MKAQSKTSLPKSSSEKNDKENYIRNLVIARIKAVPDNLSLVVGSGGGRYTKDEIIKNIEEGSELGKEIIDEQIEFLRKMAEGKIYQCE